MWKRKVSGHVFVAVAVAMLAGGSATAARADSIVGDFSAVSNPTGPWSYGWTASLGSTFNLFTTATIPFPSTNGWTTNGFPEVIYNNSGVTNSYLTILQPADELNLHPSNSGEYAVVRWTAPSAGVFTIQGQFEGIDNIGPTTTNVAILSNSLTSLFLADINTYSVPAPFSLTQAVGSGDTIDFSVGFGSDLDYHYDSTGLKGTITPLTSTPEPSSLLLIGGGMIGLRLLRTRLRFRSPNPPEP